MSLKPAEKETPANDTIKKVVELTKPIDNGVYKDYNDQTRELFIDRMIEGPMERGKVTLHAKDLGINPRTAMRWWKYYEETGEVAYKSRKGIQVDLIHLLLSLSSTFNNSGKRLAALC